MLFEVTIAEIALGRGFEFGVDWSAVNRGGDVQGQFGNPSIPDTGSTSALLRLVRSGWHGRPRVAAVDRVDQ